MGVFGGLRLDDPDCTYVAEAHEVGRPGMDLCAVPPRERVLLASHALNRAEIQGREVPHGRPPGLPLPVDLLADSRLEPQEHGRA